MPAKVTTSGLVKKLGAKLDSAVKAHGKDETDYGFQRLPGGINGGIAQLTEAYFDVFKSGPNAGEFFFRAAGTVIEPKEVQQNGSTIQVEGLVTSLIIPICDTKTQQGKVTTIDENVARVLNEMRKLGADTANATGNDLEAIAAGLTEAQPFFKFRTSQSAATPEFPNPRVWENWDGCKGLEDYKVEVDHSGDQTGSTPAKDGSKFDEFGDIDSLVGKANAGDDKAIDSLTAMALKAGKTQQQIDDTDNWDTVGEWAKGNTGGDSGEGGSGDDWKPRKGEVYKIEVLKDPRNKKKGTKNLDVEIVTVDEKEKKVTVKDLDTKKVLTGADKKAVEVDWDSLIAE